MNRVYLVDESTRVILPESQWARDVLAELVRQGHAVQATDQSTCVRDAAELARMDALLDSTGL
jgi:hypothetical protein